MTMQLVNEKVEVKGCSEEFEQEYTLWDLKEAIADHLLDYVRWLDIRFLWRSRTKVFFRVNFWTKGVRAIDSHIGRSLFLTVEESSDGLVVREPSLVLT